MKLPYEIDKKQTKGGGSGNNAKLSFTKALSKSLSRGKSGGESQRSYFRMGSKGGDKGGGEATDTSPSTADVSSAPPPDVQPSSNRKVPTPRSHSHSQHSIHKRLSSLESVDKEAESYLSREREDLELTRANTSMIEMAKDKAKQLANDPPRPIRIPEVPIFNWLRHYQVSDLLGDIVGGMASVVLLVPQGMAYGVQLGIPVIHGLYAAIFFSLVYAVFGGSKETCPANTALVTMMTSNALDAALPKGTSKAIRLQNALRYTFLVGIIQTGLGVFRLGIITHYVAHPVLIACNSAGIVITLISQLKYFLGIKVPSMPYTYQILEYLGQHIHEFNPWEFLIGGTSFVLIYGATVLKRRKGKGTKCENIFKASLNLVPILVMIGAILGTWAIVTKKGIKMRYIGKLPEGFDVFPAWKLTSDDISNYGNSAVTVALVSFLLSYGAQRQYATLNRYDINVDQELTALGLCNAIGSIFGGFAAVSGFGRASVNYEAGGKTQLASIVAALLIIATVLWLAPLFFYLPMSGLAALLCGAILPSLKWEPFIEAYKCSKRDFFVMVATGIIMLAVGIDKGIYCGIVISIVSLLLKYSYPDLKALGRLPGDLDWRTIDRYPKARQLRNIRVLRLDEALTFVNADYVKEQLIQEARRMEKEFISRKMNPSATDLVALEALAVAQSAAAAAKGGKDGDDKATKPRIRLFIVIDASGINFIDLSGLRALADVSKDLKEHGVRLLVARAKHGFRDTLRLHEKLYHDLGGEKIYLSLEQLTVLLERHDIRHGSPVAELEAGTAGPVTPFTGQGSNTQGGGGGRVDVVVMGGEGPNSLPSDGHDHRANIV